MSIAAIHHVQLAFPAGAEAVIRRFYTGLLGLPEVRLQASATLRFELDQAAALKQLNTWGGQPLPINASAWWDGMLVLRLSGAAAAVQRPCAWFSAHHSAGPPPSGVAHYLLLPCLCPIRLCVILLCVTLTTLARIAKGRGR